MDNITSLSLRATALDRILEFVHRRETGLQLLMSIEYPFFGSKLSETTSSRSPPMTSQKDL